MDKHVETAAGIISQARQRGRSSLDESAGKQLLGAFGIATPWSVVVPDAAAGERAAVDVDGPFVVKVVSPDILHKSDAGGVALGLSDATAVASAIAEMAELPAIRDAHIDGWLVEEMISSGREIVIGGFRDPQFGPMLMVGLGGIFVEVLQDVAFGICPVDEQTARDMLRQLNGYALLTGARGEVAVDEDALVRAMLAVGGEQGILTTFADAIAEADLNPVIASPEGVVAVDARFILASKEDADDSPSASRPPAIDMFRPLFEPQTIAVLGASTKDVAIANTFIRRLVDYGYPGRIYPIHPKASDVEGLEAFPSLGETPEEIDYAYIAIGAERIPGALAQGRGRVRIAQVISSGFGEVTEGSDGKNLQAELESTAHSSGIRVLGPNCLGTYSPRGGLTFPVDAPRETGTIGVVSQSGGMGTDIIKRGQWRGLRLSGLVSIGNSVDVKPHELVEYYFDDPQTRAIGMYVEDVREGRAFFELLRTHPAPKPIVILKGGRTAHGQLAAASHTGALAGDGKAWEALSAQMPVALTTTVDEFIDALLALQFFELRPERPTRSVTLFGNGGGASVLGADTFSDQGLTVAPFEGAALEALEAMGLPPGTSVVNPIDTPVRTLQEQEGWIAGEILEHVCQLARPDAIAMHLNLAAFVGRGSVDPIGNLFEVVRQVREKWPNGPHFALAMRTDGSADLDETRREYRDRARAIGVPVYDEIPAMARTLAIVGHLEQRLAARAAPVNGQAPQTQGAAGHSDVAAGPRGAGTT